MGSQAEGSGRNGHRRRLIEGQAIMVRLDKADLEQLDTYCRAYEMSRAGAIREAVELMLRQVGFIPPLASQTPVQAQALPTPKK